MHHQLTSTTTAKRKLNFDSENSDSQDFEPSKPLTKPQDELFAFLLGKLNNIYQTNQSHPMFSKTDEVARKSSNVTSPYRSSGRSNGQSWYQFLKTFCYRSDWKTPPHLHENQCWLVPSGHATSFKLAKDKGKTKSVKIVRVLAFLMDPTQTNWERVVNTTDHFDHFCGMGEVTALERHDRPWECLNGVEHGSFSTQIVNEARKSCKHGARCLCPGHGPSMTKCVFVHPDGQAKLCRNQDDCVPKCKCDKPCY